MTLTFDEGVLDYTCNCPVGSEGTFCKHCIATALAWLNRDAAPAQAKALGRSKEVTPADAAKILRDEDKDTLMRMMLDWAKRVDLKRSACVLLAQHFKHHQRQGNDHRSDKQSQDAEHLHAAQQGEEDQQGVHFSSSADEMRPDHVVDLPDDCFASNQQDYAFPRVSGDEEDN